MRCLTRSVNYSMVRGAPSRLRFSPLQSRAANLRRTAGSPASTKARHETMKILPLAAELNSILEREAPQVLHMLSALGKRFYFPKGIISQSAEAKAKAHRFNATIGIALPAGSDRHWAHQGAPRSRQAGSPPSCARHVAWNRCASSNASRILRLQGVSRWRSLPKKGRAQKPDRGKLEGSFRLAP